MNDFELARNDIRVWQTILDESRESSHPDVQSILLTSYGGSGLNMLATWAHQYRPTITHLWINRLCHSIRNFGIRPTLVVVGHPVAAWNSMDRRGIKLLNTWKILGYIPEGLLGTDPLSYAMLRYLRSWQVPQPGVALVKYEAIWDYQREICDYLQLPDDYFPEYQQRTSSTEITSAKAYNPCMGICLDMYQRLPDWCPAT